MLGFLSGGFWPAAFPSSPVPRCSRRRSSRGADRSARCEAAGGGGGGGGGVVFPPVCAPPPPWPPPREALRFALAAP
ncbi:MAG TPA: hypothetical protein DCF73_15370, partial [Rhodobiaceae bacterium]|nr:hypothetical protein [Rhodobiaceae bacterium]